ncbi:hypothetical protein [Marinobacter adhaerens]|uniref:hypothetical protein n=1 Tax=Marinobacter adhaerens TaxID=1033846 RepID=UPI003D296790
MKDKKLKDALEEITDALRSSRQSLERANARVEETIKSIQDPERRRDIEEGVKREVSANPGFLDEVASLMR